LFHAAIEISSVHLTLCLALVLLTSPPLREFSFSDFEAGSSHFSATHSDTLCTTYYSMKSLSSFSLLLCATLATGASAGFTCSNDPGDELTGQLADIDWVRPQYIVSSKSNPPSGSQAAIKGIISRAESSAKNGPWSVVNTGITPPSGNKHDFLAWAP
jgi:hypothetical protein